MLAYYYILALGPLLRNGKSLKVFGFNESPLLMPIVNVRRPIDSFLLKFSYYNSFWFNLSPLLMPIVNVRRPIDSIDRYSIVERNSQ